MSFSWFHHRGGASRGQAPGNDRASSALTCLFRLQYTVTLWAAPIFLASMARRAVGRRRRLAELFTQGTKTRMSINGYNGGTMRMQLEARRVASLAVVGVLGLSTMVAWCKDA